jgi:hypothetical protein
VFVAVDALVVLSYKSLVEADRFGVIRFMFKNLDLKIVILVLLLDLLGTISVESEERNASSDFGPGKKEKPPPQTDALPSSMKVPAEAPAVDSSSKGASKFNLNANSSSFELGTQESVVAWEQWHERIGRLLSKRINRAIGAMLGTSTVQIKIDFENKVTAELLESTGSKDFGPKCVEAVVSLDGSPLLAFPPASKRKSVTFNYKFKRKLFTIPSMKFIKDDYEHVGD